jgi:hypothetical protein
MTEVSRGGAFILMSSNYNDTTRIRQYLLGQLAGDGLDEFEHRLFTDDGLFEEVLATEDELIESSIAGELGQDEAEGFAKYFLITPERQEKLRFRKTLQRVTKAEKHDQRLIQALPQTLPWRPPSWMSWAVTSLAAVIIIAAIIPLLRPPQITFADVTLTAGSAGRAVGQVAPRIKLLPQYDGLKFHLTLVQPVSSAKAYRVEMLSDDGKNKTLVPISPNGQEVDVFVRASELPRGRYAFNVYAIKTDGTEVRIPGNYLVIIE